jgi:RepB plasmid partitioning protein
VLPGSEGIRQIEAAELMVAMNNFSNSYVHSLMAATPKTQLAPGYTPRQPKGLSDEQVALMERESASLTREFKVDRRKKQRHRQTDSSDPKRKLLDSMF